MLSENSNYKFFKTAAIILTAVPLCFFLISGCANVKHLTVTPFYYFEYNGENYRIRSISSSDKSKSRNELIGENFFAVDYNKDGIIDQIIMGKIDIGSAQIIYEYALEKLKSEGKLRKKNPEVSMFQIRDMEHTYEIRTYFKNNGEPFNEFRIVDNLRNTGSNISIFIDQNADGTLDKAAKGFMSIEKYQAEYSNLLKIGLQQGKLLKKSNRFIVKGP